VWVRIWLASPQHLVDPRQPDKCRLPAAAVRVVLQGQAPVAVHEGVQRFCKRGSRPYGVVEIESVAAGIYDEDRWIGSQIKNGALPAGIYGCK